MGEPPRCQPCSAYAEPVCVFGQPLPAACDSPQRHQSRDPCPAEVGNCDNDCVGFCDYCAIDRECYDQLDSDGDCTLF